MESLELWKYILAKKRRRKQLPLDIANCSPITLRNIILDVRTPSAILDEIDEVLEENAEEFVKIVNGRIREKYSQMSLLNDVPQLVSR